MHVLYSNRIKVIIFLEVQMRQKRWKYRKMPVIMANPKLLRPLPKSILYPKKQAMVHYNRHILNNQNLKVAPCLQEEKNNSNF